MVEYDGGKMDGDAGWMDGDGGWKDGDGGWKDGDERADDRRRLQRKAAEVDIWPPSPERPAGAGNARKTPVAAGRERDRRLGGRVRAAAAAAAAEAPRARGGARRQAAGHKSRSETRGSRSETRSVSRAPEQVERDEPEVAPTAAAEYDELDRDA
jgi:hypothetical protein